MTFDINGMPWEILEVDPDSDDLVLDGAQCVGTCQFIDGQIYLSKAGNYATRRRTLMHELTHAIHYSHGMYATTRFNAEQLCEFIAHHADFIISITDKYMTKKE